MRLKGLIFTATILLGSAAAHADTYQTFDLTGTVVVGTIPGDLTGTVVLDQTTGVFTDSDITGKVFLPPPGGIGTYPEYTYTITGAATAEGIDSRSGALYAIFGNYDSSDPGGSAYTRMVFTADSLVNFDGGFICGNCVFIGGQDTSTTAPGTGDLNFLVSGSFLVPAPVTPPTSATPEPSGLMLLGTGLVSALGVARRKFGSE